MYFKHLLVILSMLQEKIRLITSKLEQKKLDADRQCQDRDTLKYDLEQLQKKYKTLMEEKEEVLKQNKMLVLQAENEKV